MEAVQKATQIVTIKSFSPMFKGEEEATNIHIVNVEEHAFDIVAQKSLYKIGDKAVFIQPDYCLSDIPLFSSFIAPEGNSNKSRLGKNNRIKAVKFGFTDQKGNKVYSNGILMPLQEVFKYLEQHNNFDTKFQNKQYKELRALEIDFDTELGITKYEEPEGKLQNDSKGNLPSGMYKTDETNIKNCTKSLEALLPTQLIGTVKIDGSSCTIYYKSETEFGICSRGLEKYLTQKEYPGFTKTFDKELNKGGWTNGTIFIEDIVGYFKDNNLEVKETIAQDDFVQLGYPILEKLKAYGKPLSVRCEIFGRSLKGSGNKNNPHAKLAKGIAVYGIDDYSTGVCIKLPMNKVLAICNELQLSTVEVVFNQQINSIEQLQDICLNYFKTNLVEGIVVRTFNTNEFSAKFMNDEYDSLK